MKDNPGNNTKKSVDDELNPQRYSSDAFRLAMENLGLKEKDQIIKWVNRFSIFIIWLISIQNVLVYILVFIKSYFLARISFNKVFSINKKF